MAYSTPISLRNSTIYSVYVRNHTKEGTFAALNLDLDRISQLGTDILWLLPIHPIGEKQRKGDLGSPYAIKNYRSINPELGTLEDFKQLVQNAKRLGMKVIIDIVFNHTSPDSVLYQEHPEWFYNTPEGGPGNKVGDWYDIIDLDYRNRDLWQYQIDTLIYWLQQGIDGFRCDVAPLVPLDFWVEARKQCSKINPYTVWLSESVEPSFLEMLRNRTFTCHSDAELYQAFDITYDYDTFEYLKSYLSNKIALEDLLEKKRTQEYVFPENYIKMRFIENHDQPRIASQIKDIETLKQWIAFTFFEKGAALLFSGQETVTSHLSNLFDKDAISWENTELLTPLIQTLSAMKKDPIMSSGIYKIYPTIIEGLVLVGYGFYNSMRDAVVPRRLGIFNLELKKGKLDFSEFNDLSEIFGGGTFQNFALPGNELIHVQNSTLNLSENPIIIDRGSHV